MMHADVDSGAFKVKLLSFFSTFSGVPASVSWCWNSADGVAFVSQRGPLYIWAYGVSDPGVTVHKEAHSFLSDICLFRWHPTKKGKLVFGHTDGSLSIFQPGMEIHVRVKQFSLKDGSDHCACLTLLNFSLQGPKVKSMCCVQSH